MEKASSLIVILENIVFLHPPVEVGALEAEDKVDEAGRQRIRGQFNVVGGAFESRTTKDIVQNYLAQFDQGHIQYKSVLDLTVFPRGVNVKVQIEGNKDHLKNKFNSILKVVGILVATDRTTFVSDF